MGLGKLGVIAALVVYSAARATVVGGFDHGPVVGEEALAPIPQAWRVKAAFRQACRQLRCLPGCSVASAASMRSVFFGIAIR